MNDLSYEIEQLVIEGLNAGQIARQLNCPDSAVLDWMADNLIGHAEDLEDE